MVQIIFRINFMHVKKQQQSIQISCNAAYLVCLVFNLFLNDRFYIFFFTKSSSIQLDKMKKCVVLFLILSSRHVVDKSHISKQKRNRPISIENYYVYNHS